MKNIIAKILRKGDNRQKILGFGTFNRYKTEFIYHWIKTAKNYNKEFVWVCDHSLSDADKKVINEHSYLKKNRDNIISLEDFIKSKCLSTTVPVNLLSSIDSFAYLLRYQKCKSKD